MAGHQANKDLFEKYFDDNDVVFGEKSPNNSYISLNEPGEGYRLASDKEICYFKEVNSVLDIIIPGRHIVYLGSELYFTVLDVNGTLLFCQSASGLAIQASKVVNQISYVYEIDYKERCDYFVQGAKLVWSKEKELEKERKTKEAKDKIAELEEQIKSIKNEFGV